MKSDLVRYLSAMQKILQFFKNTLFQSRCRVCGRPLSEQGLLCHGCSASLAKVLAQSAHLFPETSVHAFTDGTKAGTINSLSRIKIYHGGPYKGILRDIILSWKFNGHLELSELIGNIAFDAAMKIEKDELPDIIIPVPLHSSRLRKRGFNQSLLIAHRLGKSLNCPVAVNSLKRIRKTIPQAGLNAKSRENNLAGAFKIDPKDIHNKKILLVDDIFTTGATVKECCRELFAGGCKDVNIIVAARTPMTD